ncbi:MAG: hypothetical protein K9K38_06255 [Rhodoferax sp.]|nr:hypothetical protein [Rhodoferax sp.]MCF8208990.1 hypothetical protein [Rhodoferax sp.]
MLPIRRLLAALFFCLVMGMLAVALALQTPWLGLQIQVNEAGEIRVLAAGGPAASLPLGAVLVSVQSGAQKINLIKEDLMEEPDIVNDYLEMDAFFARQSAIVDLLVRPGLTLVWQAQGQTELAHTQVKPTDRPLRSLPALFWFQLIVSTAGCLIAVWVWALRPGDWGARMFAVTGLSFPLFAMPAAVYSARELAIDGTLFRWLEALNHWGSVMFGAALVGIFLCSPRRLVGVRWLVGLFTFYNLWWLAETVRLAPDLDWGNRFAVMSEMLGALVLAGVQWVKSRGQPVDRAALRWFILSMLLGSGLFILLIVATASLGLLPPMPQGYAFGFFLVIYIGIALGLGRYRLFDLDVWAYRLLVWLGGALAVVGLDAVFVLMLEWSSAQALAISVWACTLFYLPIRHWLWQKFSSRPGLQLQAVLPDVVTIAFQPVATARQRMWDDLLKRLFHPLEHRALTQANSTLSEAQMVEYGLGLEVPSCAGIGARMLRYPEQGARLFTPADCAYVNALTRLMDQAERARAAQERGALEERQRISRDMHDDVGARLLMLIHHARTPEMAELARAAMQDLRTALGSLDLQSVPLDHALSDWRAEVSDRCEAAGVDLAWSAPPAESSRWFSPRQKAMLERTLRECVTNALKHGHPTKLEVRTVLRVDTLVVQISNDGPVTDPVAWVKGRGLRGMQQRFEEERGQMEWTALDSGGARVLLRLPLDLENTDGNTTG